MHDQTLGTLTQKLLDLDIMRNGQFKFLFRSPPIPTRKKHLDHLSSLETELGAERTVVLADKLLGATSSYFSKSHI